MATRKTRLITKNSSVSGATLPLDVLKGESVVNLNQGILFYSGSGANFTPAGDNPTTGYFEVGSNLYDLRLRNQITQYQGLSGATLVGKFLSGTSTGFVLSDISSIGGVSDFDYYPLNNTFVITSSNGVPYSATVESVSGLTINGNLTVTGNTNIQSFTAGTGTINGNLTVTGNTNLSGTTLYDETVSGTNPLEIINLSFLTSFTQTNDVYVTGATYSAANDNTDITTWNLLYHGTPLNPPHSFSGENTYTTGGTYDNNTGLVTFKRNDGLTGYTVDLSLIDVNDTYVTGGTINTYPTLTNISGTTRLLYNDPSLSASTYTIPYTDVFITGITYNDSNTISIKDNSGNTFSDTIDIFTGLTINGGLTVTGTSSLGIIQSSVLSPNLVVYTTGSGQLTTESGFGYDVPSNTLTAPNSIIGSGGSISTPGVGDLTVHGNLTVYGDSISAFTSNLYVEDNNITLNFNPTGSTISTSVNSGFEIQDGTGISGSNVNFDVVRLRYLTGATSSFTPTIAYATEYPSDNGSVNRGWITQLNDIVIRSTDVVDNGTAASVTGFRVLAEGDTLDGGTY